MDRRQRDVTRKAPAKESLELNQSKQILNAVRKYCN